MLSQDSVEDNINEVGYISLHSDLETIGPHKPRLNKSKRKRSKGHRKSGIQIVSTYNVYYCTAGKYVPVRRQGQDMPVLSHASTECSTGHGWGCTTETSCPCKDCTPCTVQPPISYQHNTHVQTDRQTLDVDHLSQLNIDDSRNNFILKRSKEEWNTWRSPGST